MLPPDFQFSQASLQDYVDCPRRFQLRYLLGVAWPALEAEPALESERRMQQGASFHRLVHQHLLGIPAERLSRTLTDPDLRRWWSNYASAEFAQSTARYPELVLSTPLRGRRLIAKYDLVTVAPGQWAVIVDWKTSRKRPRRRWLVERLQTRVYPYLLVRAGTYLNGGRLFEPEQIEMVYWFAEYPDEPVRLAYDTAQYETDEVYLASLIAEIEGLRVADFPLTTQERRCRYCVYRSLCQRGVRAGPFEELEGEPALGEDFGFDFDFEQIAEIEY